MKDEIVEITKYRRTSNSWICTECDSENPETIGNCIVCGRTRTNAARLVGPGIPEGRPAPVSPPPIYTPGSYNPPVRPPKKSGFNWLPFVIIFLIIFIIGVAYASSMNTETPEQIRGCMESVQEVSEVAEIPGYEVSVS